MRCRISELQGADFANAPREPASRLHGPGGPVATAAFLSQLSCAEASSGELQNIAGRSWDGDICPNTSELSMHKNMYVESHAYVSQ